MKELWELFFLFARIGAVTFGGGYAMLPILERELVEKRGWVTDAELSDYYAIGQCTPGIIAVNTATFVGCKRKGMVGGIFATLGIVFPSIIIIGIIAAFISNFADLQVVKDAFAGIRVCVCVLVFNAVVKLSKSSLVDMPTRAIFVVVLAAGVFTGLSPAYFILFAGLSGLLVKKLGGAEK